MLSSYINCLGVESQRIFKTLGADNTYDDARLKLEGRLGPRVNVMVERYRFHQRVQRLENQREFASTCHFGSLHDELVRDQLN